MFYKKKIFKKIQIKTLEINLNLFLTSFKKKFKKIQTGHILKTFKTRLKKFQISCNTAIIFYPHVIVLVIILFCFYPMLLLLNLLFFVSSKLNNPVVFCSNEPPILVLSSNPAPNRINTNITRIIEIHPRPRPANDINFIEMPVYTDLPIDIPVRVIDSMEAHKNVDLMIYLLGFI